MAASNPTPSIPSLADAIPPALLNVCFVLCCINVSYFPAAYFSHWWIYDPDGLGIPTDFVNVWAAGRLVLEGHPALAWDWDVQRDRACAAASRFSRLFRLALSAAVFVRRVPAGEVSYSVAFIGWVSASFVPYLVMMRAIVGRPFGWLLAIAFPMVFNNTLVGQNGFLTASLIGGTLYLLPVRPILAGVCLGLLTYKPQYGLLFPIVLIAASQWTVFFTAGVVAAVMAVASWLAFGTESWQAFFHWMPMFSQAFLTEGKAPGGSCRACSRWCAISAGANTRHGHSSGS